MPDLLEVVEGNEAWHAWWIAALVLAAPEREDTLPFDKDQKGILAEEGSVGFFVDLLVGQEQAHGLDDESAAMLAKYGGPDVMTTYG